MTICMLCWMNGWMYHMAFVCGFSCFRVDPAPNLPCMDGKRLWQSVTPADPVSKVLSDDNLLIEILLLIGYPTTLVCAALVCKRWLCHASDPAFLCRFRKLHPPRLLRFYVDTGRFCSSSRFVPMLPRPPEFDAIIRSASSILDACSNTHKFVLDSCNGNVFMNTFNSYIGDPGSKNIVLSPLCPERGMVVIPPYPRHKLQDGYLCTFSELFLKERGNDLSYFYVLMESSKERTKSMVHMYMLQDGVWCVHASATTQLPFLPQELNPLLVGNKIYMASTQSEILVLDLTALSSSTFQLPQGLGISDSDRRTMLSRADDDSGVYLIHLDELQLRIWLHTWENCLLVDTICLREMCAKWRMPDHTHQVWMKHVGRNAEFVFLKMGPCLLYLDIKCRMLYKVYEGTSEIQWLGFIHPYMMIWPPTFPALKDDPASNATGRGGRSRIKEA
ncbi:uncharacterized protein [Aegilops tauschii subsp. strangulata]|nr:uncharacterized protein LOC109780473 isoform X1 [Aegilops tauschii subsp. strangulata]XP_045089807.1 uncharacterized protein LOC109780473 isoform X1 [Aegilops tauschii subsp. strangulata]